MAALYELIDKLTASSIAGKNARRNFNLDPESIGNAIDADGRQALYSMKRSLVAARVGAEYSAALPGNEYAIEYPKWFDPFIKWPFPPDEFPKKDLPAECGAEQGTEYPDPTPEVFSIKPDKGAAGGAVLNVDIVGQGFVKTKTSFKIANGGMTLPTTLTNFTGTFRCGHLAGTVDLTAAAAGQYFVTVTVDLGGGKSVDVPSAITFTVT